MVSEERVDWLLVTPVYPLRRGHDEYPGDAVDGQLGLFGDRTKGPLVGPHQRLQRRVVERDTSGIHGDSHGRDLEVVADPGQDRKTLLAGNLFGG
jgi:hypothetical protein